jgi:hypothetical protein
MWKALAAAPGQWASALGHNGRCMKKCILASSVFAAFIFLIAVRYFIGGEDSKTEMFNRFSGSVATNENLTTIVSWARQLLADTNNLPGTSERIEVSKIPVQMSTLYRGPNEDVVYCYASVCVRDHAQPFVSISYSPGSVYVFHVFIGGEGFSMPTNAAKMLKQAQNGVFVALD